MQLCSINLENFKRHGNLSVELEGGLEISGRNGTGKSSILEAVKYCFNQGERGVKKKIKNGERSLRVELSFRLDNKTYVVEKTAAQEKPSKATLTVDGKQIADNPTSVAAELAKIMDESIWDRLLYVPQGALSGFIEELGGKEGRKKFDALFGLDMLERVWASAGDKIKIEQGRLNAVNEEIARFPKNALEQYDKDMITQQEEVEKSMQQLSVFEETLSAVKESLSTTQLQIDKLNEAKKLKQDFNERLNKLNVSIAGKQKEFEACEKKLSEIREFEKQLGELSGKRTQLDHYPKILEKLTQIESLKEKLNSFSDLDELGEKVSLKKKAVEKESEVIERLKIEKKEFEGLNESVTKVQHDLDLRTEYLKNLNSLDGASKCPRCGQNLSAEHMRGELETASHEVKRLTEWLVNIKAKVDGKKQVTESLESELSVIKEAKAQLKVLEKNQGDRTKEKDLLLQELELNENSLNLSGYSGENKSVVEANSSELSKVDARIEVLSKQIEESKKVDGEIESLRGELEKLKEDKKTVNEDLSKTSFSEQDLEQLLKEKDSVNENKFKLEGEIKETNFKIREAESKIREVGDRKREYLSVQEKLKSAQKKLALIKRAREVFHTDKGLPKYLRDKYVGQLGELLSRYFAQFNQNPSYKEVVFDRDYSIQVKSTQGVLSLTQLSGGERVQLALALRIALIELLSRTRMLILDEPFGSLDENHRELLGETLNRMSASWQLIVVTHVPVESLNLPKLELEGY